MKVIIVGGVAGGATAAARLRRLDENAEIIIFEQSGFISYANCGLPYYIGGEITEREALTLQTPQQFFNRYRIQVRVHHRVTSIDKDKKIATISCCSPPVRAPLSRRFPAKTTRAFLRCAMSRIPLPSMILSMHPVRKMRSSSAAVLSVWKWRKT